DRKDGDGDLRERDHPFGALADRAGDFMFKADRKARIVDQVEHGKMKQVAQIEMAFEFVAAVRCHRAAIDVPTIRRDDAHWIAIEADQADDLIGTPERSDLEEGPAISHQAD